MKVIWIGLGLVLFVGVTRCTTNAVKELQDFHKHYQVQPWDESTEQMLGEFEEYLGH